MTDKRLQEIKDSLDFQLEIIKNLDLRDLKEVMLEEVELYNEVVRLKTELRGTTHYLDDAENKFKELMEILERFNNDNN